MTSRREVAEVVVAAPRSDAWPFSWARSTARSAERSLFRTAGGFSAPACRALFAGGGGAGWPGAHVVADPGHDVAEVVQVVVGQGVEQQAGDLGMAGQDAVE